MSGHPLNTGPKARIADCPLARTVTAIGPWWTLEILHEVFDGHTTFEAIRRNLETPADVLADRLTDLTARDLLEAGDGGDAAGTEDTADAEEAGGPGYRLTERGRALRPLILVMAAWGNHRLAPEERSLVLVNAETGVAVDPVVVDRLTGRRIDTPEYVFAQGPRASEKIAARYPKIPQGR
ncbi:helix-turn-helix domain-containing protein [Streptomyces sp. NPDC005409]|uniref:winged helix-turn-helix transcriptional regulator n=1 Tax=Streptomyces sp. NPDC005409 TaxID=3155342 RepID=UPI003451D95A